MDSRHRPTRRGTAVAPRRMLATVGLYALAFGLLLAVLPATGRAGWFGCSDGHCKWCPYGAKHYCTAPCPCLLNECNGYFPTQWHPWPCPPAHGAALPAPVRPETRTLLPAPREDKAAPAQIMPPVR